MSYGARPGRKANANENEGDNSNDTVLIVDDDVTIRSTLAEAVRSWGYRTIDAASIAETLALVDREEPGAVLLDVKLPDGSSISVLEKLKKRSPELVIIMITGYVAPEDAFEAGVKQAYGYVTKPIDQAQVRSMLNDALKARAARLRPVSRPRERRHQPGRGKRGRPQRQTEAPLGNLILTAMKLLDLNYKDIVMESERLATINNNPDMRIGKSTLGNIISGSIRQPGTAKLDSLRMILNLSRDDMDTAIGLQPERRFAEQLEMTRARTYEVPIDAVTRHRTIKMPLLWEDADLESTQFFKGSVKRWVDIDVEYLGHFYSPDLSYVVVGEEDTNASPLVPPGSRVLVNRLLNQVQPAGNASFYQRELFYVLTPNGYTCVYVEMSAGGKVVLIPHPASGNLREEFNADEVTIIGQVVGVLYPASVRING